MQSTQCLVKKIMNVQAFFWDYDNTILETAEAHWNKHRVVLAKHGLTLNKSFRQRVYENNGSQNWEWMKETLGLKVGQREYLEAIDEEFQRHMMDLQLRPGIEEIFKLLIDLKVPQAIITNGRRQSVEPVLHQKNIFSLMSFVLCKEDYDGRKPDPQPYFLGFQKMEAFIRGPVCPARCIVVEDDPKGVESAHKAGAIVIQRKLHENQPDCQYANYRCHKKQDFIAIVKHLLSGNQPPVFRIKAPYAK